MAESQSLPEPGSDAGDGPSGDGHEQSTGLAFSIPALTGQEGKAVALAAGFLVVGLLVLWFSRAVAGVTGDAVYVTLLLAPILLYTIVTGRLKEFRGPGGVGLALWEPAAAIAQTTRTPNRALAQAVLQPASGVGAALGPAPAGGLMITGFAPSGNDRIAAAVQEAVATGTTDPVQVNLGGGTTWWSTRLFLLAALVEDFTRVPYLVFVSDGGDLRPAFVGQATPRETRRAMARLHPQLERVYLTTQAQGVLNRLNVANPPSADQAPEIDMLVGTFAIQAFPPPGIEVEMKEWVTPALLARELGTSLFRQAIEMGEDDLSAPQLVRRILDLPLAIVPLSRHGQLQRLVDRCAFATELARDALIQPPTPR